MIDLEYLQNRIPNFKLIEDIQNTDHSYVNDWWKPFVLNFVKNKVNANQIKEEIRARNSGYAHFDGEHNH